MVIFIFEVKYPISSLIMKKLLSFIILLLTLVPLVAQQEKPNTVKLNFYGFLFRTVSLQYERTLNDNSAALVHFGYTLPRSLPKSLFSIDTLTNNGSINQVSSAKFTGGIQITPEYRYYFKGEGNKGFYLGAYLRYANYGISALALHRDDSFSMTKTYQYTGTWKSMNIGLIMGNQWQLGENLTLDWWILGLQFGTNKISMTAAGDFSSTNKSEYIADVTANFKDTKFLGGLEAGMTNTEATLKFGFPSPGLRTGLCLGFRF